MPKATGERRKRTAGSAPPAAAVAVRLAKARRQGGSAAPAHRDARQAAVPSRAAPPTAAADEVPVATTYLTPEEVEEFRALLHEKRAQLVGDVGTLRDEALRGSRREASGDLSSMPVHMADLGSDNYEMEFNLGLLEDRRAVLSEIDEALERVRQGTYGVCQATGKPIGKARLRAKPWAKFCYEYTLALEKGRRHGT